jgi:hypothetical protein
VKAATSWWLAFVALALLLVPVVAWCAPAAFATGSLWTETEDGTGWIYSCSVIGPVTLPVPVSSDHWIQMEPGAVNNAAFNTHQGNAAQSPYSVASGTVVTLSIEDLGPFADGVAFDATTYTPEDAVLTPYESICADDAAPTGTSTPTPTPTPTGSGSYLAGAAVDTTGGPFGSGMLNAVVGGVLAFLGTFGVFEIAALWLGRAGASGDGPEHA